MGMSPIGTGSDLLALLHDGANITQLALMFGMKLETVSRKLRACPPIGTRNGHGVYSIGEAARYISKPIHGVEEAIRNMHPSELPAALRKEYWQAQNEKIKFEENQGDLFRTEDVLSAFAEAAQEIRMQILLLSDAVEKQIEFTDKQRDLLKKMIDGTLGTINERLQNVFGEGTDPEQEADDSPIEGDDPELFEEEEDEFQGL